MLRAAKFNITLALLSIAILIFNPAGICAGGPMAQSPSHPCCPSGSGPQHQDSLKSSCVCIDRQPAAPSLPSNSGSEQLVAVALDTTPQLRADQPGQASLAFEGIARAPQDRCLQFHQLLV
jgi:hypothetical protein